MISSVCNSNCHHHARWSATSEEVLLMHAHFVIALFRCFMCWTCGRQYKTSCICQSLLLPEDRLALTARWAPGGPHAITLTSTPGYVSSARQTRSAAAAAAPQDPSMRGALFTTLPTPPMTLALTGSSSQRHATTAHGWDTSGAVGAAADCRCKLFLCMHMVLAAITLSSQCRWCKC